MTTATESAQQTPAIEEFQGRIQKLKELSDKEADLRKRESAIGRQINELEDALATLEQERQGLASAAAEGKDKERSWVSLTTKASSLRAKREYLNQQQDAIRQSLAKLEAEQATLNAEMEYHRRSAWAEVTGKLMQEAPEGINEWLGQILTSLDQHQSLSFFSKLAMIFPKEWSIEEQDQIRRELAARFEILED